jgi:hypothetical protein
MPLDAKWLQDFQKMVIIESPTKIDTLMVLSKSATIKFPPHFDHTIEEHPTFFV